MKKLNQNGFVAGFIAVVIILVFFWGLFCLRIQTRNEVVSGIAYNTTHDAFISGNTRFSVRAAENTPVTEENRSSYCLPPNSPYKEVVNKAAEDKTVKVIVKKKKTFTFVSAPWKCVDNVEVTEQIEEPR